MPSLKIQAGRLADDLSALHTTDLPSWSVGLVFNALLEAAKADGGGPIVDAIEPATSLEMASGGPRTSLNAGELRVLAGQIAAAL